MKKKLLLFISIIILSSTIGAAIAKSSVSSELAEAIKLYKAGNYSECYVKLESAVAKDPTNPLGYYYKAMTAAQIGKKEEAIENYEKTLALSQGNGTLSVYAQKGKRCLETPDKCKEAPFEDELDEFIRGKNTGNFSDEARGMFEKLRIEQMMRNMNRGEYINPEEFKRYKDFSSMNDYPPANPTNDEIVSAVKTLQNAGLLNFGNNNFSDLSLLTGNNSNNSMLNVSGMFNMNPQLIQALITNNMSMGF